MVDLPSLSAVTLRDASIDVPQLCAYLQRETRDRPVVVITYSLKTKKPFVDVAEIEKAAGGKADVVVIPTADMTFAMTERLGKEAGVFNGACRVYPAGSAWLRNPRSVPLRMAKDGDAQQIKAIQKDILQDLAFELSQPAPQTARSRVQAGVKSGPAAGVIYSASGQPILMTPTEEPRQSNAVVQPSAGTNTQASGLTTKASQAASELGVSLVGLHSVATADDARRLAQLLLREARAFPVVVTSRAAGQDEAYVDAAKIAEELQGLAAVYEITRPGAAWTLTDELPDGASTYGGITRVYPPGPGWQRNPYQAEFFTAYSLTDRDSVTNAIISAGARSAARSGSYATAATAPAGAKQVSGEVQGVVAGRAMVRLEGGGMATIWPELTLDAVEPDRLFVKKMQVSGPLDPETKRIDVRHLLRSQDEMLSQYLPGITVPVRVDQVNRTNCLVELVPRVTVPIDATDITETPDLRLLMTRGETLLVAIVDHDVDSNTWLLSAKEADAEYVSPAANLLPGGPAWLDAPVYRDDDEESEELAPETGPSYDWDDLTTLIPEDLDQAKENIGGLYRELTQANRRLSRLEHENHNLEQQLKSAKTKLRDAQVSLGKTKGDTGLVLDGLFDDDADQMDFEIRVEWAQRIPSYDKASHPLPAKWSYGPDFFATLNAIDGIKRDKIVSVIVEVLTGLATQLDSRDVHQLRSGPGGDDPTRQTKDGETYWRVALQTGTSGARRLHYLKKNDGSIMLSSVRLHDDFRE
jgi:hypothetical protein